ncbi:LacI family transcriptional regulator [Lachnospiraceae bacterium ASD3451]|uniref:LacI family DNA-binding transcriptional regulator n=1 Tax=Diplocloster agilis TaxID=2850323 RepID=UPI001DF9A46D|nr:LacI family DNA-binding transcriptional regulator [Diplocloster agilis]MBU9745855.1 LacI family transcriptional regulator [Diplocloster agilis]
MTLRELAKYAGVSPATVSLVINEKPGVNAETRARVQELIKEYSYQPTRKKSTIKTNKHILFLKYLNNGMIVEDNADFISTIMDSIEGSCRKRNYTLSIMNISDNPEKFFTDIDYDSYDGIILLGTEFPEIYYPLLYRIQIPFIVVDNNVPNIRCNSIAIDNNDTVFQAVGYLASLGHRTIGYFRSNMVLENFNERADAFYRAVKYYHLETKPCWEYKLTPSMMGAYEGMKIFLDKGGSLPDSIFADNDTIAIGAIKALKSYQYKIPKDLSIMGVDDIIFSEMNSPSLTTMNIPKKLIGSMAVQHLHAAITDSDARHVKTRIGGSLVVRNSTAQHS